MCSIYNITNISQYSFSMRTCRSTTSAYQIRKRPYQHFLFPSNPRNKTQCSLLTSLPVLIIVTHVRDRLMMNVICTLFFRTRSFQFSICNLLIHYSPQNILKVQIDEVLSEWYSTSSRSLDLTLLRVNETHCLYLSLSIIT